MIPLADILFGDKKFGNTLNLNKTTNNTVAQSERKERIDIRNNMTDKKEYRQQPKAIPLIIFN